jgi:hypothetical protein
MGGGFIVMRIARWANDIWFFRMFEVWQPNQVTTDYRLQTQPERYERNTGLEFTFFRETSKCISISPVCCWICTLILLGNCQKKNQRKTKTLLVFGELISGVCDGI